MLQVYATIVFTLTKMYSMTVIGNYKDSIKSEARQGYGSSRNRLILNAKPQ